MVNILLNFDLYIKPEPEKMGLMDRKYKEYCNRKIAENGPTELIT